MIARRRAVGKSTFIVLLVMLAFFLGAAQMLSAAVPTVQSAISIAPSSIPVPETGTVIVGMERVQFTANGNIQFSKVDVQLISSGGFNASDIQAILVYYEKNGGNGLYDNGEPKPPGDDLNGLSGGPYTFSGGVASPLLNTANCTITNGDVTRLYVAVQLKSSAATAGTTIGVQVTRIYYALNTKSIAVSPHNVQKPLDKYSVNLTATGIAPATEFQGNSAANLKLVFAPTDTNTSTAIRLATLKVHAVGSPWADSDLTTGGVVLYEDTNANGTYDSGTDSQVTSGTLASRYATLTPSSAVIIPSTGKTLFVVVNITLAATAHDIVKLEVTNPSTDVTFTDAYADDTPGSDYVYVPPSYEYVQKGYITSTSATPTTNNSTDIQVQTTPQPPIVQSIVPGNSATDVSRSTTIVATFSKNMKASTINTTNFKLWNGATQVPGTVSFDGTTTATFTPSSPLAWGTSYTPTIYGNGTSGVQDNVNNLYMASNKVWNFTTVYATYPTVLSTSPVNASIEVPRETTVTATFSKAMDPATLTTSTFTLFDGISNVLGTVSYDAPTRTATFTQTSPPLPWGTVYTATITTGAADTDGLSLQSNHAWTFTTNAPVYPLVSVTSPANGASEVSRTATITATFSKDMNSATVIANFKLYDSLSNLVAGTVTWDSGTWTATLTPSATLAWGENYSASVLTGATSGDGLPLLADKVWTFTTTSPIYPQVSLTTPANGDNEVAKTTTVTATFSKNMTGPTVQSAFSLKNHLGVAVAGTAVYDVPSKTLTFTQSSPPLLWGETYTARIETTAAATDGLTLQSAKVWTFTTTMPNYPTVPTTSPIANEIEVSRTTTVTATFSKDMDPASITTSTFTLFAGATQITGTVGYNAGTYTATFTPSATLDWGTTYTATLTTAVAATDGLHLQSSKVWNFKTTVAIYPIAAATSPVNNANEVARTTNLTATFSREMNPATINGTTFTLKDSGNNPVAGTVSYNAGTFTATFDPTSTLLWGEVYTATMSTAAAAIDGLTLQSNKVWTFTTTQPVYPAVSTTSPTNHLVEAGRTINVTATFSKDMNPASLTGATFMLKDHLNNPVAGTVSYDAGTFTATFDPTSTLLWGEQYTATITTGASSTDGLVMQAAKVWDFTTVAAVYPIVSATFPSSGGVEIALASTVRATFSKDMNPATINGTTFTMKDSLNNPVAGTVSYNAGTFTATFTPSATLAWSTTYTVTVSTAATATDGLALQAAKVWNFQTVVAVAPAISATSPASDAKDITRGAVVSATFSKDMDASTITSASFTMEDAGGVPIAGTVGYDGGTRTATFTPASPLSYNQTYSVTVKGSVRDVTGLVMSTDKTWTFKTIVFEEPVVNNNKIVPGGSPASIFIPQPPAGAQDPVTVQVFTATGRRVATLVDNRPYSEIVADLPLLWDGVNGKNVKLGPGLYFVQIRATGFVRTLKIMIVR